MKIAVLGIRGLPANYGGFETCAEYVTKDWASTGNEVLIYCRKNNYKEQLDTYNGCRLKYIKSINTKSLDTLSHTLFCIFDLIFKEGNFDKIHLYNAGNALFLPILKLFRKETIISVDGIEWKRQKWGKVAKLIHKFGESVAVKFADEVVVDNKAVGNYYMKKHKVKTELIPYGAKTINNIENENSQRILNNHLLIKNQYFLFVGRLVPEKGVHTLLEAYKRIDTDIPLVIIGDDNGQSEYKDKLFRQKSDKIKFLGFLYGEEYETVLKNAYLYISASELEGTSPSLLAAMGAKVCTLVNGIEENLYTIEDAGFYYKENDLDDFCKVWDELIKKPELVEEKAKMGFERVSTVYKWENISKMYLALFHK